MFPKIFPLLYVIAALALVGCPRPNPAAESCIQPCATTTASEKELSGKVAGKLDKFKADADAEAKYKESLKNDFAQLSDANAAFCLGLRAIECYHKHHVIDDATAQMLAAETLRFYRSKKGISGGGDTLSPYEKDLLRQSPDGDSILDQLRKYKID